MDSGNREEFPIEASISQIEVNGEKLYTVVLRDITDRKRAEEQQRESEQRFRILADSSPVLIWVNGLQGCEFVNRSYMEFLGLSMDEVIKMDWTTAIHPEDVKPYVEIYHQAFEARAFEAFVSGASTVVSVVQIYWSAALYVRRDVSWLRRLRGGRDRHQEFRGGVAPE